MRDDQTGPETIESDRDETPEFSTGQPTALSQSQRDLLPPRVDSEQLFGGREGAELLIEHNGQLYRLRRTRKGNLILHK